MSEPLDLITGDIQHSNLFSHMPLFDEIYYLGHLTGKVRKYKAIREDQPCIMLALNVIKKEEDILWKAVEDFIKRAVSSAALSVHGVYVFDLLTIDIHKEINTFKFSELAEVIVNHARKLPDGGERLIKYSSSYGILRKLSTAEWGKIKFTSSVEVFKDKSTYLDLLVKKLIKNFEFANDPGILLLNDLSHNPIFELDNEEQKKRLDIVIEKQIPKSIEFLPEVYIQDKNNIVELLSGMTVE